MQDTDIRRLLRDMARTSPKAYRLDGPGLTHGQAAEIGTKALRDAIAERVAAFLSGSTAGVSETTGPVPRCDFSVGQPVRLAKPYAEMDPDGVFYVTGIHWDHRRHRTGAGWDITIATAAEIEKGLGATDGYSPADLVAVHGQPADALTRI